VVFRTAARQPACHGVSGALAGKVGRGRLRHGAVRQLGPTWRSRIVGTSACIAVTCVVARSTPPRRHRILFPARRRGPERCCPDPTAPFLPKLGLGRSRRSLLDDGCNGLCESLWRSPPGGTISPRGDVPGDQIASHRLVQPQTRSQEKILPAEMLRPRCAFLCMREDAGTTSETDPRKRSHGRRSVMPETRLKCPSCEGLLKLSAPLAPGKAIKCPKCGAAVRAPAATGKSGGPVAASRPAPRPQAVRKPRPEEEPDEEAEDLDDEEEAPRPKKGARRAADDEDEDFDDRPRKRGKKSKKKQGNPLLLWGSIGGGIAAILIVVVVLFATGVLGGKKDKNDKKEG